MASHVSVLKLYRHPRSHQLISRDKALRYMRRTGKRIRPEKWLFVRQHFLPHEIAQKPSLKKRQGRIEHAVRLSTVEKIIPLSSFSARKVRQTLANKQVYKKLWLNWGGEIRITVGGYVGGRKVKKIIHLAFQRNHWNGMYEEFKDWLTASIVSNLRRAGLRLSNQKESERAIADMRRNRTGMMQMMEFAKTQQQKADILKRIQWASEGISKRKKTKQIQGAFIKIEKLV